MAAIIVGNDKKILTLFPHGPALGKITSGALEAVARSFEKQNNEAPLRSEVKRRFELIMNVAVMLRGDLLWGVDRIVGAFPHILDADAAGGRWEPTDRACWIPSDGA